MPFCAGMGANRQFFSFDQQAGRAALILLGDAPAALIAELAATRLPNADTIILRSFDAGPQAWTTGPGAETGLPIILCQDDFFARYGLPPGTAQLAVIDRASRLAAAWPADSSAFPEALATLATLDRELPAPILPIPHLFPPALCTALIDGFEASAHFDSGVAALGPDGKPLDSLNHDKKRRRDWMLTPGDPLHDPVLDLLFHRCSAEIKRAYQADITHADRVLVARYDDTGGYFRRHRDNAGEAVAFRQFALSVNLNAGYEGGHLLFPEFNDTPYRPAPGAGIAFSTSLLHEATPVTKGTRYVLLTFLHDARHETRRLDSLRRRAA